MASPRCFFMELPTEIRLEIYSYLIQPTEIHLTSEDSPTIAGLSEDVIAKTRFHAKISGEKLHLSTLRTCRQIHAEAAPLLTKPSLLRIYPSSGGFDPSDGRLVDVSWLSKVSQLDVLELELSTIRHTSAEDLLHSTYLASWLKDLRLGSLKLIIDDHPGCRGADKRSSTQLSQLQQLLDVWAWLRPSRGFEFKLNLYADDKLMVKVAWDTVGGKKLWKEQSFKLPLDTWDGPFPSRRHDAIVDMIKQTFPLPML